MATKKQNSSPNRSGRLPADWADEQKQKKRVHIIKRGKQWAVLLEHNERASRVLDTKPSAIAWAQPYRRKGYDVIVHRKDGSIEAWLRARP